MNYGQEVLKNAGQGGYAPVVIQAAQSSGKSPQEIAALIELGQRSLYDPSSKAVSDQAKQQAIALGVPQDMFVHKESWLQKADPYIAAAGAALMSGGALGALSAGGFSGGSGVGGGLGGAGTSVAAPAAGTISGTGLGGATGIGALTASTPAVGSLSAGALAPAAAAPVAAGGGFLSSPWLAPAITGGLGALAAGYSAKQQSDAGKAAAQASMDQFNTTRADLAPWREAGTRALAKLEAGNFEMDPGYQFRQSEGEKGINRGFAARGGYDSGAALKALTRFNQDYATNEYGNVYNRLAGLAGTGQTAVNQTGAFGAQATDQSNNYNTSGAAARGAGAVGISNAITGGFANAYNNYNQGKLLDWWKNQA